MSANEKLAGGYPPEDQRRWDISKQAAEGLFADQEETQRAEQVWSATRALYVSDIPT